MVSLLSRYLVFSVLHGQCKRKKTSVKRNAVHQLIREYKSFAIQMKPRLYPVETSVVEKSHDKKKAWSGIPTGHRMPVGAGMVTFVLKKFFAKRKSYEII
jgi:hypothetical protein